MSAEKDIWDKAEVVAKVLGSVLVPSAIAISVYLWNSERSALQTQATMTNIAVSILTSEETDERNEVLREWAASVLKSPENPPKLSDEAVAALIEEGIQEPASVVLSRTNRSNSQAESVLSAFGKGLACAISDNC